MEDHGCWVPEVVVGCAVEFDRGYVVEVGVQDREGWASGRPGRPGTEDGLVGDGKEWDMLETWWGEGPVRGTRRGRLLFWSGDARCRHDTCVTGVAGVKAECCLVWKKRFRGCF